jgi:large subunit ribosomal protein L10
VVGLNLATKKELVEKLNKRILESQISILVDYKGLDVEAMTRLRTELRKERVQLEVVKNTLLSIASKGTDCEQIKDTFLGPNALATCKDDAVAPARILTRFAKDNDKLEIKIGVMNGAVMTLEDIKALSKLPAREVLLSQLLSVMQAVPTGMVRVLSEVPRSFAGVIKAIADQKEAA